MRGLAIILVIPALILSVTAMAQSPAKAPGPEEPGKLAAPQTAMVDHPCPPVGTDTWAGSESIIQNDWASLCRYRAANAALDPKQRPVAVFMGDSITERWNELDPDFFAHGFLDRGISGQTSPQMLVRFMADVVALHPQVVHIMAGTNDVAGNTGPNSPEDFKNNIRAMVDLARANGISVVIGSIPPADHFGWSPEFRPARQIAELNRWLRDYASAEGLVYADYYAALADMPDVGSAALGPRLSWIRAMMVTPQLNVPPSMVASPRLALAACLAASSSAIS